jgi:hypothetical protein
VSFQLGDDTFGDGAACAPFSTSVPGELPFAVDVVTASFTVSPTYLYEGAGNHTLTLLGSGTSWSGGTTFSVTSPLVFVSKTVVDATHASIVVSAGVIPSNSSISDGVSTTDVTIGAPSFSASPSRIDVGSTGNVITLTGSYTIWQTDSPTFTLSGGTGASITAQSIIDETTATVTVTAGSTGGALTITDPHPPSTGATAAISIRTIATANFNAWLANDQRRRVVLCELDYRYEGTGAVNKAIGSTTVATASTGGFGATYVADGKRVAHDVSYGGANHYWDATGAQTIGLQFPVNSSATFPNLNTRSINTIDVYFLPDDYTSRTTDPTSALTGTLYLPINFNVKVYSPSGLAFSVSSTSTLIPGGAVTGNNKVYRRFTFPAIACDGVRIEILTSQDGNSHVVEIEAYSPGPVLGTAYLSNVPYSTEPGDVLNNTEFLACIAATPAFSRIIDKGTLGGRMQVSTGDLLLDNADHRADFLLNRISDQCDARFYIGSDEPGWSRADFATLFYTSVVNIMPDKGGSQIRVKLRDKTYKMDAGVALPLIGGSGTNSTKQQPVVLAEGYVECLLQNAATSLYTYSGIPDPAHNTWNVSTASPKVVTLYANGVALSTLQYTDHPGTGTLTLNVAQAGAKLIAHVRSAINAGQTVFGYDFYKFFWQMVHGTGVDINGAHPSYLPNSTLLNDYLADRFNPAERMDAVALSDNSFWGVTRDGLLTWGRIRPQDYTDHSGGNFVSKATLGDDDVIGDIAFDRMLPQYSSVTAKYGKHATFDTLASTTPTKAIDIWRDPFGHATSVTSTLSDYAGSPESYHLSMAASPEIETLHAVPDIDSIYATGLYIQNTTAATWVAARKSMLAPYIEFRTFDSKLDYYTLELADLVTVNMPTKAGDTADTTWQVLGVGIDLMSWRTKLTLVRRRTPTATVLGAY